MTGSFFQLAVLQACLIAFQAATKCWTSALLAQAVFVGQPESLWCGGFHGECFGTHCTDNSMQVHQVRNPPGLARRLSIHLGRVTLSLAAAAKLAAGVPFSIPAATPPPLAVVLNKSCPG